MTYKLLLDEARRLVDASLATFGIPPAQQSFSRPPDPAMGEVSSNVAFRLAKGTGRTPYEVATDVVAHMDRSSFDLVASAEAHPGGYVNFRVSWGRLAPLTVGSALSDDGYGIPRTAHPLRVAVEHTSVNPNKALHIGHLRNVVVGDAVARLMEAAGHGVTVLNYVDDTGVQVADVVLGFLELGLPQEPSAGKKLDHYYGDDVYVRVTAEYEKDPALAAKRKDVTRQLEEGRGPAAELASKVVERVLREQLKTCWRVGAEYDLLNYESQILRKRYWEEVFGRLKAAEVVRLARGGKFDGCWVMDGGEEEEEKVLVRSDGTAVYAAKDIPYAAWKLGLVADRFAYSPFGVQPSGKTLWAASGGKAEGEHPAFGGADLAVTVIGVEQTRLQKFVTKALERLGMEGERYLHLAYEKVVLGGGAREDRKFVQMKGRTGVYVGADDVVDALAAKAKEESKRRNPGRDEAWLSAVAEGLAVAAIRYELLKQDLNKLIVFDMDQALKLEGDTGPYLLYTYARAASVLKKGGRASAPGYEGLHDREKELVLLLSRMEGEVEAAVENRSPKGVCRYAHDLATAFNSFYEACPVIGSPEPVKARRLQVTDASRKALGRALYLVGIPALDAI